MNENEGERERRRKMKRGFRKNTADEGGMRGYEKEEREVCWKMKRHKPECGDGGRRGRDDCERGLSGR